MLKPLGDVPIHHYFQLIGREGKLQVFRFENRTTEGSKGQFESEVVFAGNREDGTQFTFPADITVCQIN